ncbi:MAG TPA: FtsX-like permease family protein, partial [Candidatus Thermoplasmatota archaeon]|nr:FtsX-like permease family protein [Candidatus Thermoplasmatota archaeon]
GSFLRADQPVLSTLRAIGIPSRAVQGGYVGLTVLAVAAGAFGAVLVAVLVLPWVPPVRWTLSGLNAEISLRPRYVWLLVLSIVAVGIGAVSAWAAARRVGALNILEGLKRF